MLLNGSVVAAVAGEVDAADRVELDLPETGVCGIDPANDAGADNSCCAATPSQLPTAVAAVAASALRGGCATPSCASPTVVPVAAKAARCCG